MNTKTLLYEFFYAYSVISFAASAVIIYSLFQFSGSSQNVIPLLLFFGSLPVGFYIFHKLNHKKPLFYSIGIVVSLFATPFLIMQVMGYLMMR